MSGRQEDFNQMVEAHFTERRARIMEAARDEFARYGHAGSRVQRIVDRAGVNKQLIFYYFGSKDGLYRAVMEESWDRMRETEAHEAAEPRATVQLRLAIRAVYLGLVGQPHLVRLLVHDGATGGAAGDLGRAIVTELENHFSLIVSNGQRLGYFRDNADPTEIARHTLGLMLGHLCLDAVSGQAEMDPGAAERFCDLLLRSLEW
jgi:AcrR family transcriptional regulator